jgi:sulfite reductase (NADPH) hemoprotein beta-component
MSDDVNDPAKLTDAERTKAKSRYLRGTIAEGFQDRITASISDQDNYLLKFHGMYQQDDRDLRNDRMRQKLEPAYGFMIRVRIPGGVVSTRQWLLLDRLGREYGGDTMRLTTRQTVQLHGMVKWDVRSVVRALHEELMTSIAACGDINRNIICNPNPSQSSVHEEVYAAVLAINDHLLPKTTAYHEIWISGEKAVDSRGVADSREAANDEEPLYGPSYMPRKFKIAVAVPPSNDVDVFAHDLGLIALVEDGTLAGFNIVVGGGMGATYGEPETYPQVGTVIGFCPAAEAVDVAEKVLTIQRDFGDRTNRKHARFKYTIDDRGRSWFIDELAKRRGKPLEGARAYEFTSSGDRLGWVEGTNGTWHLTLFIENGRIRDWASFRLMTGLRKIAEAHEGDFRLTPNQNLIIANVPAAKRTEIQAIVDEFNLSTGRQYSALRQNAMACVALPTCGLAMAEAERYLPALLDKIEVLLEEVGLRDEEITIRMSGCPNGCSRPYVAEIAFTGKAPGSYNLYLGAAFNGTRLNRLYRENIGEEEILSTLKPMFARFAAERLAGEHFGDFVVRAGYVRAVTTGQDFHSDYHRVHTHEPPSRP